jgi:hypothetical protein
MALFRASIFNVRVSGQDVAIGPAGLLQVLLSAADRACDRARAGPRARAVAEIMKDVSFDKAKVQLPMLCFQLMQNVGSDEQKAFGVAVQELQKAEIGDAAKAQLLGLSLMNVVGSAVLKVAIDDLDDDISVPPKPILQSIATLQLLKNFDFSRSSSDAVTYCLFVSGEAQDDRRRDMLGKRLAEIQAMGVSPEQQTLILSAVLIKEFGEETLQTALRALQPASSTGSHNVVSMTAS